MRLVSYEHEGAMKAGILLGESVIDAEAAARQARIGGPDDLWGSNRRIIQASEEERAAIADAAEEIESSGLPLADTHLGPPIPDPDKIPLHGPQLPRSR